MTADQLINKDSDSYKIVIVPKSCESSRFVTWESQHPVTNETSTFVIHHKNSGESKTLFVMDRMQWDNSTVKNAEKTVDGNPFRCLFVTREGLQDALVLGISPDIYVLSKFSPVYFLLSYFKPIVLKNQGEDSNSKQRLLSYRDLIDAITVSQSPVSNLVTQFNLDLKPFIEQICERVEVPSMDSDDENDEGEFFYKPSLSMITRFIENKIANIVKLSESENKLSTLKLRIQSMFSDDMPLEIKELYWRKQAFKFMSLYVDAWYINETEKTYAHDFTKLNQFISDSKKKFDAQAVLEESLEMMHGSSTSIKRGKLTKTVKSSKKASVKVKSGALDMFFKKKDK